MGSSWMQTTRYPRESVNRSVGAFGCNPNGVRAVLRFQCSAFDPFCDAHASREVRNVVRQGAMPRPVLPSVLLVCTAARAVFLVLVQAMYSHCRSLDSFACRSPPQSG